MTDASDIINKFQAEYPDLNAITPAQAVVFLTALKKAAATALVDVSKEAINPLNLPTAQKICADSALQLSDLIQRINDGYLPYLKDLASDPATNQPGAGNLVRVFSNAGLQNDPFSGRKHRTPEYLVPYFALLQCNEATGVMNEAYQDLWNDVKKNAAAVVKPIPWVAAGVGLTAVILLLRRNRR